MEDVAFEARRAVKSKRRQRVRTIGFTLIGLFVLAATVPYVLALISVASDAAHKRMLARLVYPMPPAVRGVHTVTAFSNDRAGFIVLRTPDMPFALTTPGGPAGSRYRFEFYDFFEKRLRVAPPNDVHLTIYGPPKSWAHEAAHILTFIADGEELRITTPPREYHGDGWELRVQDRLDFTVPTELLVRVSLAQNLTGTLDGTPFAVSPDEHVALRHFAAYLAPGIEVSPPR